MRDEKDDEVVEELVTLVLDHLVPVAGWYRDQLAHRLGISPAALSVLEQARLHPTTAGRSARWTAMTPSAMSKVIRRLEDQGHVTRSASGTHEQELMVELAPHDERDRLLASIRERVRNSMQHVVSSYGLTDPMRRGAAAGAVVHAGDAIGRHAAELEARRQHRLMTARRHAARRAAGLHP